MKSSATNAREQKVSLLALIFFLMGALPLYSYFQAFGQSSGTAVSTSLNSHPLVRMTILGLAVAGAIELVNFIG